MIRGCPELGNWYLCEFANECEKNKCAYSLAKEFDKDLLQALEKDAYELGYGIQGIEQTIVDLNNIDTRKLTFDGFFDSIGHLNPYQGWKKLTEKHPLKPYLIKNKVPEKKAHLRASERGCYLAQIISKLNKEKISEVSGIEIKEKLADIGSLAHAFRNQQHISDYLHNKTLTQIGIAPLERKEYCEKKLVYILDSKEVGEIVVGGSADAVLELEGFALGALDFKRHRHLANPKRSHKRQVLTYALALAQIENHEGLIFGVLSTRPAKKRKEVYRKEVFDVWLTESNGTYIKKTVNNALINNYKKQAELLKDKASLIKFKERKESSWRGCNYSFGNQPCFVKEICDWLVNSSKEQKKPLEEIIYDSQILMSAYLLPSF